MAEFLDAGRLAKPCVPRQGSVSLITLTYELSPSGKLPERKQRGHWDVYAAEDTVIPVSKVGIVETGIRVSGLTEFQEMQIRARSSLAARGIIIANGIGSVDWNYRDTVKVLLLNLSGVPFAIGRGDRIAQLVFASFEEVSWVPGVIDLFDDRKGGIGSTGIK